VHRLVQAPGTAEQVDQAPVVLHPRGDTVLCRHGVVVPQAMLGETGVAASREDATWPTCMLLCRRACYCSGACGAPHDKFRGQKCIFKVQEPAVHHVTSLGGPEMHFQSSGAYMTHA
jgi:hypothetical protein